MTTGLTDLLFPIWMFLAALSHWYHLSLLMVLLTLLLQFHLAQVLGDSSMVLGGMLVFGLKE